MAADIDSSLNNWSTSSASNAPTGSTAISTNLDDNLREIQSVVRTLADTGTIVSATTTDLSTVSSAFINITATNTITGLGTLTAGMFKTLIFADAATLTHNATSLILPGSANITAATNDTAIMLSLGSGNWKCLSYSRADGEPLIESISGDTIATLTATQTLTNKTLGASTITGDFSFGDNVKANFGAGNDLQIYHDGSNSYITDQGAGDMYITTLGSSIYFSKHGTENLMSLTSDGAVSLYYDNALKLATTSTGIDVTGTVTADGLTVDGAGTFQAATPYIDILETDSVDANTRIINNASVLTLGTLNDAFTTNKSRLSIDHATGDISFYNSAGDTAKFFWDASAESLAVGNSSLLTNSAGFANTLGVKDNLPAITIEDTGTGTGKYTLGVTNGNFGVWDNTTSSYPIYIKSDGNVGIGTSSPAVQLDVRSGTGGNSYIDITRDNATSTTLRIGAENGNTILSSIGAIPMVFNTNGTEAMRIDSSGNVGIGVTPDTWNSTWTAQQIAGLGSISGQTSQAAGTGTFFSTNAHYNAAGSWEYLVNEEAAQYYQANGAHYFRSKAAGTGTFSWDATAVTIDASGNVGIGATPTFTHGSGLEIERAGIATLRLEDTGSGGKPFEMYVDDGTGAHINSIGSGLDMIFSTVNTPRMRIDSSGNLLVGVTSASQHTVSKSAASSIAFLVSNTSATSPSGMQLNFTNASPDDNTAYFARYSDSTAQRCNIYSDGDVWTSDAGTLTSDERLKTNIQDATPKLEDVLKLKVKNFEWTPEFHPNKVGKKNLGFIAQEFEEVFPALVTEHDIAPDNAEYDEDGNVTKEHEPVMRKAIKDIGTPILVKCIQEQQDLINSLTARIEALENA